jgi:hypothetical protein
MVLCQFGSLFYVYPTLHSTTKRKVSFLNENIGNVHESLKKEACGPYLVGLLNLAPIYEWCMARLILS